MMVPLLLSIALGPAPVNKSAVGDEYLAGYLIVPVEQRVDRSYNAGYSMYVAAWPLQKTYPGHQFQTGLPGTWMFAQPDGQPLKDMYSDVEGGLGWWRDTRFPTETPKFIMGGVAPNFSAIANGPAHGWGTWEKPQGLYGVAQLSPWLLFPIDGLNLKQKTCGELFGWGYFNLPLAEPKTKTEGKDVPTGANCWTLFVNSTNFKGPVAFFLPNFWSHAAVTELRLVGQLLDSRPVDPNRQIQMETQYIPCRVAVDSKGESYARIAPTAFPRNADGRSVLVHQDSAYNDSALFSSVKAWFAGGSPSSGKVDLAGAHVRTFPGRAYSTWEIRTPMPEGKEEKVPIDWDSFAIPTTFDDHTFGYQWSNPAGVPAQSQGRDLQALPEYFHLAKSGGNGKAKWVPVSSESVPTETGLQLIKWERPVEPPQDPYTTPDDRQSSWKKPGPKAGPFKVRLGDGSTVTYYWYRFADQPALLNADLTAEEREVMQVKVEKLHRAWKKDRDYLPPPKVGKLTSLDPAQIVKPPKGLEVGYVPIATRQELAKR
jgi:hypothetical protein